MNILMHPQVAERLAKQGINIPDYVQVKPMPMKLGEDQFISQKSLARAAKLDW